MLEDHLHMPLLNLLQQKVKKNETKSFGDLTKSRLCFAKPYPKTHRFASNELADSPLFFLRRTDKSHQHHIHDSFQQKGSEQNSAKTEYTVSSMEENMHFIVHFKIPNVGPRKKYYMLSKAKTFVYPPHFSIVSSVSMPLCFI